MYTRGINLLELKIVINFEGEDYNALKKYISPLPEDKKNVNPDIVLTLATKTFLRPKGISYQGQRCVFRKQALHFYYKTFQGTIERRGDAFHSKFNMIPQFDIFRAIMRAVISSVIFYKGGSLIHSSAVSWDNRAILFPAPGNSGKSTISEIVENDSMILKIADETSAIFARKAGGTREIFCYPFPFGLTGLVPNYDKKLPIHSILFLKGWKQNRIRKINNKEAVMRLLHNAITCNGGHQQNKLLLEIISAVASSVPCYMLSFKKDKSIVDFLAGKLSLPSCECAL